MIIDCRFTLGTALPRVTTPKAKMKYEEAHIIAKILQSKENLLCIDLRVLSKDFFQELSRSDRGMANLIDTGGRERVLVLY